MMGLLLLAAVAAAGVPMPVQCEIIANQDEAGPLVVGKCGTSGVMLGSVTSYESAANVTTGAVVAVIRRGEAKQVLLIRSVAEGTAFLENITPDLARLGGRAPHAGLGDLTIDLTKFATDGVIGVADPVKDGETSPGPSQELSVLALIAADTARLALPAEEPRVIGVGAEETRPEAQ